MVKNFKQAYQEVKAGSQLSLPLHDMVTLASIIEKETGAPQERPMISSVFHNRLKKGMRLQSDPTIIYGIMDLNGGKPVKNISKKDIITRTRYNTYKVKALPYGPHCQSRQRGHASSAKSGNFRIFLFCESQQWHPRVF